MSGAELLYGKSYEQFVRETIEVQIDRRYKRIAELESSGGDHGALIDCIRCSVDTLIELQHELGLCGCPPEAYEGASHE